MKVGIIAEDNSDVEVLQHLTIKIARSRKVSFKKFVGNGCGKIKRKCHAWTQTFVRQGCSAIVLLHDLDRNQETQLRNGLQAAVADSAHCPMIILIPVQEIEAWLLFDPGAIAAAFREKQLAKLPKNPESLQDPKRTLGDVVWKAYRRRYVNTVHNGMIARNVDVQLLKKARSFFPYPDFIQALKK